MQLAHREAVLCAGVNDREIELLVGRLELDEQIENHVEHLVRPGIFAIDLVDDNDRLGLVLKRLAQHESCLRLRTVVRIDHQQARHRPSS